MGARPLIAVLLASAAAIASPAAADLSEPGPFAAGRRSVTVTRPNGSTFTATLHYPALAPGVEAAFDPSGGPYPVFSFGHGFLSAVTLYQSTLAHLASHGWFAIASQSEGGLFPSHGNFANDIRHCLDHLIEAGLDPGSPYFGAVAGDRLAVGGHSMGGGSSMLAAAADPRILAVVPLAAADTNPSSIAAAAGIEAPLRLIVGSQDTIVPPGPSGGPMYANAPGPRQLLTIEGGFHCGFIDSSIIFCDSGSISRDAQLRITRRLMLEFLEVHAGTGGDPSLWRQVWGPDLQAGKGVAAEADPRVAIALDSTEAVAGADGLATIEFLAINTGEQASDLAFAVDSPFAASIEPASAAAVPPGGMVEVVATIGPIGGKPAEAMLEALRGDGARAWSVVALLPATPPAADLDGNGIVNGADLAILLANFGGEGPGDLDGNGSVDGVDLAILLQSWSR